MSVFAIPALIALITKLYVYLLARKAKQTPQAFLWLLVFFAVHNLSEFLVISELFNNKASDSLLRTYYLAVLFSLAYLCIFVHEIVSEKVNKKLSIVLLSIASLMSLVVFLTDSIIAGAVSVDYTVTAIKGEYYSVFQITTLLSFAWIAYTLGRQYLSTVDIRLQLKCFYTAFALSPIIIMAVIVIIMMQLGYQYTGAILLPFMSTFFLLLVVLTEKNSDIIRIRHRLPFSPQRAEEKKILALYRSFSGCDLGLVETKTEIEKILIQSALVRSDDNVSLAAHELGIKRSTLYSIFNRLGMERRAKEN